MSVLVPILSEFRPEGVDKAISQFQQLEGAGAKAGFAIKKAALPAAAALGGLAAAGFDAAQAAMEDQQAQVELARQLKISTGESDKAVKAVEGWISASSAATGVADDELRPALASLARATGSLQWSQDLLALSLDVSAATGKDLATVSDAIGKAANGSTKGLKSLDASLIPLIKDGASTDELFQILGSTFEGAAGEKANTAAGKFARLKLSLNETKESIGAALLPAIESVIPYLERMASWASEHQTTFLVIAGVIGGLAAAIVTANVAIKAWEIATKLATAAQWLWNAALNANPISLVVIGLAALAAGVALAYTKFEAVRTVVDAVGRGLLWVYDNALKPVGKFLGERLVDYLGLLKREFQLFAGIVQGVADTITAAFRVAFNFIADAWNNTVGKLSFKAPSWIPGIGGKGWDVPNIPKLAAGGIVTKPTLALIGEAGPEAVVPLSRNGGVGQSVSITIQGAIDPVSTAYQIRQILNNDATRLGRTVFV